MFTDASATLIPIMGSETIYIPARQQPWHQVAHRGAFYNLNDSAVGDHTASNSLLELEPASLPVCPSRERRSSLINSLGCSRPRCIAIYRSVRLQKQSRVRGSRGLKSVESQTPQREQKERAQWCNFNVFMFVLVLLLALLSVQRSSV